MSAADTGPVLFAYDGSELASLAIEEAGRQLGSGREAIVLTVWQPFNVGFLPVRDLGIDAAASEEVQKAAEETAAAGASLAERAGFRAQRAAIEAAPTWKGICDLADQREASLIVLGSHGRHGFPGMLVGSVAGAVAAHSRRSVLIVHRRN